ncbi:MAG: serine/threonine-protein kinase [Planctomycetota bacterium]|nr:serine/threonine-protein kinase [Planctomycetota bacterium]MDA1162238.1 serine/threonine-protein kinase [Planctomycetota bacterium]
MSDDPQQQKNKIDDYILIAPVASGKSATVWEVMHEQSNQMFAMKLLNQNSMQDPDERTLLKQEAKIGSLMEHPNLIRNHGVVIRKTECYLLMDLFKTPNLKAFIHSAPQLVHMNFRQLVEGICAGLGHMHGKGWVHRDLKPENILLNRAGEVRLIDFSLAVRAASGIGKLLGGSKGPIRGTRTYLAPETIKKEATTPATDIYSLGITFFESLTGTVPFKGETPQDLLKKHIAAVPPLPSMLNERITPEMDRLILKMLAKKPKDRHQSMDELAQDFKNLNVFKVEEVDEEQVAKEREEQKRREASGGDLSAVQSDELRELMGTRRDSRSDARIQAMIHGNPAMRREYEAIQLEQKQAEAKRAAERKRRADAGSAPKGNTKPVEKKKIKKNRPPQQPMMSAPMPMPPGYGMSPQQMPYGMPPQGYPQPGMPMQQPGMPMQQPGMPMQQLPQPLQPQQVAPGTQQHPQQHAVPAQQPPPTPQKTPPPPVPAKDDGMEFMTELPDFD